jgi:ribonucleoside-triphosphate reductase
MGSPLTEQRGMYAALNNCAFVSTDQMKREPTKPFTFLMDASMLGVGVGFDTKGTQLPPFSLFACVCSHALPVLVGAGTIVVKGPNTNKPAETFVIPDTREGWVEALRLTLDSYFHHTAPWNFDTSLIRPAGRPIKGFGGGM